MTGDFPERAPVRSFAFGPFTLIPERQLLLHGDAPVRIGGRALDILTALVKRPGELVSKRELMACAWPNMVVDEGNLKVNMVALRRALGEGPGAAEYIATVVGRGYRFVAPVQAVVVQPRSQPGGSGVATTCRPGQRASSEGRMRSTPSDAILTKSRLVSIVGAGGIGKTTVALAVAEHAVGLPGMASGWSTWRF